jgi:hypothetical protein
MSVTFKEVYCTELDGNISASGIRRIFFSQDDESIRYHFHCSDQNCNVQMDGVNIYSLGIAKRRPYFRTHPKQQHSLECLMIKELGHHSVGSAHQGEALDDDFPSEFILQRLRNVDADSDLLVGAHNGNGVDEDFYPRSGYRGSSKAKGNKKPNQTSYLENVVDSFEGMDLEQRKTSFITLNGSNRSYKNTFKDIRYFEDGENFIFYGEIIPIKPYGKNFSIKFKNKACFNGSLYSVSIYILDKTISNYRMCRLFRESIQELASRGESLIGAVCYFVGAYPRLQTVFKDDLTTFQVLRVDVTNLDHLVIKFSE